MDKSIHLCNTVVASISHFSAEAGKLGIACLTTEGLLVDARSLLAGAFALVLTASGLLDAVTPVAVAVTVAVTIAVLGVRPCVADPGRELEGPSNTEVGVRASDDMDILGVLPAAVKLGLVLS